MEDALFAIGFYYKDIRNLKKAKEYWARYLEMYPEGKYITIIKGELKE